MHRRRSSARRRPRLTRLSLALRLLGTLDAEGKLTGHITASYRTDDEVIVRALARSVAPADWDKASQYVSSNIGFSGTTSNTSFKNADDLSSPIVLTYDYARHPYGTGEPPYRSCLPALEFSALASDSNAPPTDIELGAPRTLIAISRIRLPEGYGADLPDPSMSKPTSPPLIRPTASKEKRSRLSATLSCSRTSCRRPSGSGTRHLQKISVLTASHGFS